MLEPDRVCSYILIRHKEISLTVGSLQIWGYSYIKMFETPVVTSLE